MQQCRTNFYSSGEQVKKSAENWASKVDTWKGRVATLEESATVMMKKRETQQRLAKDIADLAIEANEV